MANDSPLTDPFQAFSREEIQRYARHFSLAEVGAEGQGKLKEARVLLVGAGGLGSPAALYLAAAGVGTLGIADGDRVELSNLQRQVLHGTPDVGRLKVESAVERLQSMNPEIQVEPHPLRLTAANALDVIPRYDVVLDGSDNFPTRYLVNDACVLTAGPGSTAPSSGGKASSPSSAPLTARATGASSGSRRLLGWCPGVPRPAWWGSFRGS
jgi:molybdopterin/thiamine biosynthesis adenylyltransferase